MLNDMSTPRLTRTSVEKALDALPPDARDVAAQQLARLYATLIDEASIASKYRESLRLVGDALPLDEPKVTAAFAKITDALARHSVASDLGPKLLAVLVQLGLTPGARNVVGIGGGQGGSANGAGPAEPFDELRNKRDQRGRSSTG